MSSPSQTDPIAIQRKEQSKPMKRRDFLKKGLAAAGGAVLAGGTAGQANATTNAAADADGARAVQRPQPAVAGGFYAPNRAPLAPTAFSKLPTGSVTPQGWIRRQLLLQAEGLCGRMPEVSDYLKYEGNGWVDADSTVGWEEVPYWLRGFGDLGYVLGDQRITALATKWVHGIMASQSADGWFGPKNHRTSLDGGPDMWPHMPILNALQSYHEYTGDTHVFTFLTKYFQFQDQVPAGQFIKSWAGYRCGDNIETIHWLYNRTGGEWLLALAKRIHDNSADYTNGMPTWHNVNVSQGFREPAEHWLQSKEARHLDAAYHNYDHVMDLYGQFAGGGFAGDENSRPSFGDPRQGFETCGIVELMHSFEMLTRISGDPVWADRCEYIAFNSMPAAFDPQGKGTHYITSANSIQLDDKGKQHAQFANGSFPMQALKPGVHDYRCCPHNYGMGWPYYAQEMWLATADSGLCASLYGASEVRARVGDGTAVTMTQETDYPFGDTIHFKMDAPRAVSFPLYLRVPGWCAAPTVRVNGKPIAVQAGPQSYLVVEREWRTGDSVTLHLPMAVSVRTWQKNQASVSVDHGPLTYSLAIAEKWHRYAGTERWPEYEVFATSPWNYGLEIDKTNPAQSFDIVRKGRHLPENPWTHETNPVELRVRARRIPGWQADRDNVVTVLQPSPARTAEPVEMVTLIPMGAARLRITSFPTVSADGHEWVAPVKPVKPEMAISASFVHDDIDAVADGLEPKGSNDQVVPRLTFWDHKGTSEWVQYDYPHAVQTTGVSVYWFDDAASNGGCRVPKSWRLLVKDGDTFKPVAAVAAYGVDKDGYNRVTFPAVTTTALKLEMQLQDGFSGGILEWKVERQSASNLM